MVDRDVTVEDVDPGIREGAGHVLQQPVTIPALDLDLHAERGFGVTFPLHRGEAVRILAQHGHVGTVLAMDRDAATEGDVADDLIAGHRATALGDAQHDVVDAVHHDPECRARGVRPFATPASREQVVGRGRLGLGGLPLLQPLHDLVDHDLGLDLRRAERDVEVVALLEAHLADHVGQQRRGDDLLGRQTLLAQRVLEQLASGVLGVTTVLRLEPVLDLVPRPGGLDQSQPITRRSALPLGGQHLADVAGTQRVGERHDLAVDLGADAAMTDVGVDLVGEVQRGGAGGERLDLALGREDEDLVLEQVDLEGLDELLGIGQVLLPLH